MTTVTIRKRKFDLEQLVEQALENAPNIHLGYIEQNAITLHPEAESRIRFLQALSKLCNWGVRWEKLADVDMDSTDDIINAIGAMLKVWNRRAGARALSSKYGKDAAEQIIYNQTGRKVTLRQ